MAAELSWQVDYSDDRVSELADSIVRALRAEGVAVSDASKKSRSESRLVGPEIVFTVIAVSAAKAVVVGALQTIEKALEKEIDRKSDLRTKIILIGKEAKPVQKVLSLKDLTKESLKEFVSILIKGLEKM